MTNTNPKIGLIDIDLLDNGTRHPNLALMKISMYCKQYNSKLIYHEEDLDNIERFDILIMSKVFTFSEIPAKIEMILKQKPLAEFNICIKKALELFDNTQVKPIIAIGGTGFFEDGGINLHHDIEHIKPDYHLYDHYIEEKIRSGKTKQFYDDYLNYSIGFMTRGCFRKCDFCVNKKYDRCLRHASVSEFIDLDRPKIYLWDDNVFASSQWSEIFDELNATGKPFQFRQGLDLRLLDHDKAEKLSNSKYYGDIIFAFDHVDDYDLIDSKLKMWREHSRHTTKLYVLCSYDPWFYHSHPEKIKQGQTYLLEMSQLKTQKERDQKDIEGVFKRIELLMEYGCLPYIMRYELYKNSVYRELYIQIARWCNQPNFFKKKSFREFCEANQAVAKSDKVCATLRAMLEFEKDRPDIAKKYFDLKYEIIRKY